MTVDTYLYPFGVTDARSRDEIPLWRESYRANVACRNAIQSAISRHFDGMNLDDACLDEVIADYGYKRTTFVLANTLKQKIDDGRFHRENIEWSRRIYVPPDREHNDSFAVNSHPAVLDGFIRLYRNRLDSLGLFQSEHCEPNARAELDYTDRVLVLSREVLSEDYWEPKYQLWYAHDGFGCSPHAIGRSIRATCLADGELTRWNRSDFLGPIKDEFLPDWAREQAERLREGQTLVDYEQEPAMQEMTV